MTITKTALASEQLIQWFRDQAKASDGHMPAFTNADIIADLRNGSVQTEARAQGQVQSRVDFACYLCNLPPLGLTADKHFEKAWDSPIKGWEFPVRKMQAAAQTHKWIDGDFQRIEALAKTIGPSARKLWGDEMIVNAHRIQAWAESFNSIMTLPRKPSPSSNDARIDWTTDELILALDQYLSSKGKDLGAKHPEIIALSDFLNRLGAVLNTKKGGKFRNPNGVAMKILNFRRHDIQYAATGGKGLLKGNQLERPVWDAYSANPGKLAEAVSSIRATVAEYEGRTELSGVEEGDIVEAPEGKLLTRLHRSRERNRKLVDKAKKIALNKWGRLFCEGCSFDFGEKYGAESAHIIDCHHTKPVSTLPTTGDTTFVKDLVLLCPNCHRVVHSRRPWLSIEKLKERLAVMSSVGSAAS